MFFCLLSITFLMFAFEANASDQYLVCKPVTSVFDAGENQTRNFKHQPCSGKQGARGLPGSPGPRGPPGSDNHQEIISTLQAKLRNIERKLQCVDGVVVDNLCYKLIYRVGVGMNYERSRSMCAYHGGGLAEIPTKEVYDAVFKYVQTHWYADLARPKDPVVRVWLGSTFKSPNVIMKNGRKGFTKWLPGNPTSRVSNTRMAIHISTRPEDKNNGMYHCSSYRRSIFPLCQFLVS